MSDVFDIYLPLALALGPLAYPVGGGRSGTNTSSAGSASVRGGVGPSGPGVLPSSLPSSTGGSSTVSPSCKKQN